jgi:hypothetical protein
MILHQTTDWEAWLERELCLARQQTHRAYEALAEERRVTFDHKIALMGWTEAVQRDIATNPESKWLHLVSRSFVEAIP